MSHTYLIFFGKSQDFTFHAFDNQSYVPDFDQIIADFDELESKIFTPDDVSYEPILSKYTFIKNGRKYSLLKLYSFAQAYDSARISGSIYGVGLLSDQNIKISETNVSILNAAKDAFAQSALAGLKFKSSNFLPEVEKIWNAVVNHKDGNYMDKVDTGNFSNVPVNNRIKAFFVNNVFKSSIEPPGESTSRLYYSADVAHLKRTQARWGEDNFPIFNSDNTLVKEKRIEKQVTEHGTIVNQEAGGLKSHNDELQREVAFLRKKNKRHKQIIRRNMAISALLTVGLIYALYYLISESSTPGAQVAAQALTPEKKSEPKIQVSILQYDSLINIMDVIRDNNKSLAVRNLYINLNIYDNMRIHNPDFLSEDRYLGINRDAKTLGIDTTFFDTYKPK